MSRLPVLLLALVASSDAWAGGLGLFGTGDIRTQHTYYYRNGNSLDQYELTQWILGGGAGFEVILGDKDDRLTGVFRGYWVLEAPEKNPADLNPEIPANEVTAAVREEPRNVGVAMAGLSWAYWGDPEGFALTAQAMLGSGFLTKDHTEYFQAEIGPGVSWEFAKDFRLFFDANYQFRYRKGTQHGVSAYLGVRYLFD